MTTNWQHDIDSAQNLGALDEIRINLLGKNGAITQQLKSLGTINADERKVKGAEINSLKEAITIAIENKKKLFEEIILNAKLSNETIDITLPGRPENVGKIHPVSKVIADITDYFNKLGFQTFEGPHIESAFYNFDALNIPAHHPARQDHDTFYLKNIDMLLRTQTSAVQIHTLKKHKPPIRFLAPGRTFRSDHDATHTPMFHQMEGVVIEDGINFSHLKGVLIDFCRWFFNDTKLELRLRPSFFPFTEPSAEVDIAWGNGWLEVLGCGMIHPNVLRNAEVDETLQGFAFGMGIERFAMLKYGINDIRSFYDGDTRWLQTYGFSGVNV
jgi:phenylalanyl-tRNA synthetase alpha chain